MLFRQDGRALVVHTPAKLNLFLEVLGKRPDGYHALETLMVTVGWYDTLSFAEDGAGSAGDSSEITLRCRLAGRWSLSAEFAKEGGLARGPRAETREKQLSRACLSPFFHKLAGDAIPAGEDNLVLRAARLLVQETGLARGVRIELWKRIPPASGLAGGSSDAAATLAGLNRLWRLGLSRADLAELAGRLGSDVPFFLSESVAAICRGRGELIEPLRLPANLWFVIGRPAGGLSTAEVYRHCRPAEQPRTAAVLAERLQRGRVAGASGGLHNALEAPATGLSRDVATLRSWFDRQPVSGHLMSGSGTACFAVCRSSRQARRVARRLESARLATAVAVRIAA